MTAKKRAKSTVTDEWDMPMVQLLGATTISTDGSNPQKWDDIISFSLIEWGRNPSRFGDEIIAPTSVALNRSCQMAINWRDSNVPPPLWVVPSGDGGIYFRWGIVGQSLFTAEFTAGGNAKATATQNCEVVWQEEII
jgi:hypothetical protein